MKKYEREELEILREFMDRMKDSFPSDESGYACMFCDMGGAGYSCRGEGFHDDKCPYLTIKAYYETFGDRGLFNDALYEEEESIEYNGRFKK